MSAQVIPDGYMEDGVGRLVPIRMIRPIDLQRDQLVRDLVGKARTASAWLADLKGSMLRDVDAHCQLSAEPYCDALPPDGVSRTANVILETYDKRLRVERVSAERVTIGEEIQAAERLIRAVLDDIDDPIARAIADRTFRRNPRTRELSVSRLVDLVAVEIDDERWRQAVAAIRASMRSAGAVTYFRAYHRDEPDQDYVQVVIDFSAVQPAAASPAHALRLLAAPVDAAAKSATVADLAEQNGGA